MESIPEIIRRHLPRLVEIRRHLHENPELGHKEFSTVSYLERQIANFGICEIKKPASTSLSITIGPTNHDAIAFRADIDALPVHEETALSYKSSKPDVMHACGHDVHSAIVLGLIPVLLEAETHLKKPIKLIFQQAEEVAPSGAPYLIAGGVLEAPTVCEIYGIHVWPHLELGQVGIRRGAVMGSLDGITISIQSRERSDTHERAGGKDAILLAAMLINEFAKVFHGRHLDDSNPAALLVGMINGGSAPSHFARNILIKGSLRALNKEARSRAINNIQSIIDKLLRTVAAEITLDLTPYIRPHVINADSCVDRIVRVVTNVPECEIHYLRNPLSCSDDFGCYLEKTPGAYVQLGSRTNAGTAHPLHSSYFNIDERVIEVGSLLLANIALDFAA